MSEENIVIYIKPSGAEVPVNADNQESIKHAEKLGWKKKEVKVK